MWLLWILLIIGVVGYFIYRTDKKLKAKFEDKFNPHEWDLPRSVELPVEIKPQPIAAAATSVKINYGVKHSALSDVQRPIFIAMQQALAGEYFLLNNINAGDVLSINSGGNNLAVQVATKSIAERQFDFVVCDKYELRALCVISLGESLDSLLEKACEDAHLPFARFRVQSSYDISVIRASLLKALGVEPMVAPTTNASALDIREAASGNSSSENIEQTGNTKMTESGIALEQCPECSAIMLKRKAKSGASAGKLFWICSTYPKCRGILPLK